MPEMNAPRALVFRPLVKGNEDSGNEIEGANEDAKKTLRSEKKHTMPGLITIPLYQPIGCGQCKNDTPGVCYCAFQ